MVENFRPTMLADALQLLAANKLTPYCGGTDLMVHPKPDTTYLFVDRIDEMKQIAEDAETIRIGAACTFTELIDSPLIPNLLKQSAIEIAAPAIRNFGSIGGNICNGSPKADTAVVLFAAAARLRLVSQRGERLLPIADFYLGRNKTVRREDELLVEIQLGKAGLNHSYFKKVGARNALAIARVSFAGVLDIADGRIAICRTAFGAVSDIVICRADFDALLIGKTIVEAKSVKSEYIAAYDRAIVPIRGRVSAEYRKTVCLNLLRDFLETNGI